MQNGAFYIRILHSTASMGKQEVPNIVHNADQVNTILDAFASLGHSDIDTARCYADGTSEYILGEVKAVTRFRISTKILAVKPGDHRPENLKRLVHESLTALQTNKVSILYLHAPDRGTPLELCMQGIQQLYEEGLFEEFGLSNFSPAVVKEVCEVMQKNNWIMPSVYEGLYNFLSRRVEEELFPLLDQYHMRFHAYSPLVGGFLDPKLRHGNEQLIVKGSQFDPEFFVGKMYREWYWHPCYFEAVDRVHDTVQQFGMSAFEAAMRWIVFHSNLDTGRGDGVIIGGSTCDEYLQNLSWTTAGPLPEVVLQAMEKAWTSTSAECRSPWM
ncbi:NADP-dependent oxidoreductase domain-containing protein [Radiomyces spectabilis]|uniref:NADP-dependent oxidoreductase domain-containing protein n=1 Tax=Radiomyces spectabilis TaxID=64574 RepID=UPI002220CD59|nr:NADP-dependent oxidoreductase domain-containing protein [Radiomyces spectabilis]KAI8379592.1 NADP-dependent oxidoreductase domain-containing protein [Radiomyces spectabilis]